MDRRLNDPKAPPGTYRDTCEGCRVVGTDLVCNDCANAVGSTFVRPIHADACIYFGNTKGQLVCEELPPGDYKRTCEWCELKSETVMTCDRCDGSEGLQMVEITDCAMVSNQGGKLICTEEIYDANRPQFNGHQQELLEQLLEQVEARKSTQDDQQNPHGSPHIEL